MAGLLSWLVVVTTVTCLLHYLHKTTPPLKMSKPPSKALSDLLALPLDERIKLIQKDVRTRKDRFAGIEPHALAEALGVPNTKMPGGDGWGITAYAEIKSLDDQAAEQDPVSEFVYLLEGKVTDDRFAVLKKEFEKFDDSPELSFDFLTKIERKKLEEALARKDLERNMSNGISSVAQFSLGTKAKEICFEGYVEDDGACIRLRTPYDKREGKFIDLDNCVTEWW